MQRLLLLALSAFRRRADEEALDKVHQRALGHAAGSTNDAVREHAQILVTLADDEDDAAGGGEVGGCEDGDVRIRCGGAEREPRLDQT